MEEQERGSALEKNVAELTVMDVYDIAALVGHEFERVIDQHGCEAIARLMPKVVRVLEILEVLVSRHHVAPELDELRLELDRLRLERVDRIEKERKHQKVGRGRGGPLRVRGPSARGARTGRQGPEESRGHWGAGGGTGSGVGGALARPCPAGDTCPVPPGDEGQFFGVRPEFQSHLDHSIAL